MFARRGTFSTATLARSGRIGINSQIHIIDSAVNSLAEQAKLAHTLQCAVTALAGQSALLRMAAGGAAKVPGGRKIFNELLTRQKSLGPWAQEVQQNHNHAINLPGIINMWVILEASIEDLCVFIILDDPDSLTQLTLINKKIGNDPVAKEEDARRIYERCLQRLKSRGLVSALFEMLAQLGVKPSVRDETEDHLKELNYVRNCALHRNGIVEARKEVEAPTLPIPTGTKLNISDDIFLRYYDAAGDLLSALHTEVEQQ